MILKFLLLSFTVSANTVITKTPDFTRVQTHLAASKSTKHNKLYGKWRREINPFIPNPYATILDKNTDNYNEIIYEQTYHTEDYGLRVVPGVKKNLPQHLIVSGDSNAFGVGCADNQTTLLFIKTFS